MNDRKGKKCRGVGKDFRNLILTASPLTACQTAGSMNESAEVFNREKNVHKSADTCHLNPLNFIYQEFIEGGRSLSLDMTSVDLHNVPPVDNAQQSERVEDLLRFVRSLDAYSDPERLLCSLPAELCSVVMSNTTALIHIDGDYVSWYAVGSKKSAIGAELEMAQWQDEIFQLLSQHQQPVVISSLDQEVRFPGIVGLFSRYGNQSLCILPLNKALGPLGALCFAREQPDGFSQKEICLLSLIADNVALAIDDRLNFAHSEALRVQLESEQTKLKLILDLNNSVVSNVELREVLRSVSPSIRKTMSLDGVALILPDVASEHLQVYALDFPDGKGVLRQGMSRELDSSLAGQVFRSGKPWVGDIEEWNKSGFDDGVISEGVVETICMLPLIRCRNIMGVLCLVRMQKNAFTDHA